MHKSLSNRITEGGAAAAARKRVRRRKQGKWNEDKVRFWGTKEYCIASLNVLFMLWEEIFVQTVRFISKERDKRILPKKK